jgi:hypothetical protein
MTKTSIKMKQLVEKNNKVNNEQLPLALFLAALIWLG